MKWSVLYINVFTNFKFVLNSYLLKTTRKPHPYQGNWVPEFGNLHQKAKILTAAKNLH